MTDKELSKIMGTIVRAVDIVQRRKNGTSVTWTKNYMGGIVGWLVGVRYVREGIIIYGYGEEPNYFDSKKTVKCYLVSPHPRMRPVHCLDIEPTTEQPALDAISGIWTDNARNYQRVAMMSVKRDAKGRWLKCQ